MLLRTALFMLPIALFGMVTIFAVQNALGFPDPVRDMLAFLLLVAMLVLNDEYGPDARRR